MPKRSSEIDLQKAKRPRKILYIAEILVLILFLLVLEIDGFWQGTLEKVWDCENSGQGEESCSVCADAYRTFLNRYIHVKEGYVDVDFYGSQCERYEGSGIHVRNDLLEIFLVLELIICLLQISNSKRFNNKICTSIFAIGSVIAFAGVLFSFVVYCYTIITRTFSVGVGYVAGGCEGGLFITYKPSTWSSCAIGLLILAIALNIGAKIINRKAKCDKCEIEVDKPV